MADLNICRVCLRSGIKMYRLDRFQLKAYYEEVIASKVNNMDNLPQYFCYECAMLLHKYHKFKEKCYCALKVFKEMLWRGPITYTSITKIDKNMNNILPMLQVITESNRIKSYSFRGNDPSNYVKAEGQKSGKVETEYIGDNSLCEIDDNFDILENDLLAIDNNGDDKIHHMESVDVKREIIKEERNRNIIKEEWEEHEVMKYHTITNRRTRFLDANNWKKYTLPEEGALEKFKSRADNIQYLRSAYKCTNCYKGFSKEEMLNRHIQLRHSESLGNYECRFCKMRFKWDSHLRIHMRQHLTEYKCLRCEFVCPIENSAILHDECHSGITRKCIHCEKEFRHTSTYYTHLRKAHRSEHVCTLCGLSFVSETGLHQHKKIKHVNSDIDSPDDDDDVNTHCAQCNIRFETRKAYEEHLFHSLMHADGVEHEIQDEVTIPRKVQSKRLKAKITKELYKRKRDDNQFSVKERKQRRKMKREKRKPTTCHQCGQHFETQSACMKHHLAEHPGTSFYPPTLRHICEICGASLAPGSVAVHQNIHTREKVFPCELCSKQFHSSVGLKRHFVTHTGEKRFACNLCEKRFTQSNSLKLHYKTFHLKQPYPKRNRRGKKECHAAEGEMSSEEEEERSELDSLPDPDPEPLEPENNLQLVPDHEETVHYLTLN